ncbi:MAG: anti-sigma factor, partial [Bryobacteraceae bacterium]
VHTLDAQKKDLAADRDRYDRAVAILASPDTQRLHFTPSWSGGPALDAFVHAKMGVVVAARGCPMPAAGHAFQLWMVPMPGKGPPVSAGMYMPESGGAVLTVAKFTSPVEDFAALAVTEEPASGSPKPTSKMLWFCSLR